MKATRVPAPINLEVSQEEAELIALLLSSLLDTTDNRIGRMVTELENVGVRPTGNAKIEHDGYCKLWIRYFPTPM
jgi:hypothetical protein